MDPLPAMQLELDARGWTVVVVEPDRRVALCEEIRGAEWDRGWRVRTSYHEPSHTLSIVRSGERWKGSPGRASRDTPKAP